MSDMLEDVLTAIPDAILDIRYATASNIAQRQLYRQPLARLRTEPLASLAFAAAVLRAQGYTLVIFDTYREPDVQRSLQAVCADTNYVAIDSNHCRGITVDLTLADTMNTYLDMGTEYDDFTSKAHSDTTEILDWQQKNRDTLVNAMHKHGFVQHPYEWWHFDFVAGLDDEVIDSADNVI